MFTVLHRHADSTETFYEAASVIYIAPESPNPDGLKAPSALDAEGGQPGMRITDVHGTTLHLFREHPKKANQCTPEVFVMNAAGKTVARYAMN